MTKDSPSNLTRRAEDCLCIGSVLWDVIGTSNRAMRVGSDVPGRITREPGGVALNVAKTLARFDLTPGLLSVVGRDAEGDELVEECRKLGLVTDYLYRSEDLPTDQYMAIEGAGGLIAAIADAHSLEKAGQKILTPLLDGSLGDETNPYDGLLVLDGNLTEGLLDDIARHNAFRAADLRVAPASPGKAERLSPFLRAERGTLYVNLEEAGLLCQTSFEDAETAALRLVERGAARAIVTNGGEPCCDATQNEAVSACPPQVLVVRITGAGDTFMAAHIAAERRGENRADALTQALDAAARYVSGDLTS